MAKTPEYPSEEAYRAAMLKEASSKYEEMRAAALLLNECILMVGKAFPEEALHALLSYEKVVAFLDKANPELPKAPISFKGQY
jgi:hypothetical protein